MRSTAVLTWMTGQSIVVIAVLVFGAVYLLAAIIIAAAAFAVRRGLDRVFQGASPGTLAPISVTFALLVGFVAADVWPTFDRAQSALGIEAARLHEAVVVADTLPESVRSTLRRRVQQHIDSIVAREWPAMASRRQSLKDTPLALHAALGELLSINLNDDGQRLARARAVAAIEDALDARRQRILLSQDTLGGIKAFVLFLLTGLVMVTIAIVHIERERRGLQILTVAIFATAAAACMLAILVYDRPFGGGGISLSPERLIEVRPD
jgi:hypothetical protein